MASARPRRGRTNQQLPPPPPEEEEEEETNSVSDESESATDSDSDSDSTGSEEDGEESTEEEEERGGGGGGGGGEDGGEKEEEKEKGEEEVKGESDELGEKLGVPNCPVCMEMWTSEGPHRVCCIPCGHVYGRLCLEKWLKKCGNKVGKCPQCNRKFKPTEIINLYAPKIVVPNDDLQKEVESLREKNNSLNVEITRLLGEIQRQRNKLQDEVRLKRQKTAAFEYPSGRERQMSILDYSNQRQNLLSRVFSENTATSSGRFVLQNEVPLNGARVMCIDASSEMLLVCSKASGILSHYLLNKISLLAPREKEEIQLPHNMKAVKDMCVLNDGLIALTSLGRKLALFSTRSNNIVLQYDLPAPGWSCSGDDINPHHIYAGLQNGKLLVFDVRQTAQPLHSLEGLSTQPVHTVHTLNNNNNTGIRKVLTASSAGPCVWDVDNPNSEGPTLIPGLNNQGICISLACSSDNIVASFRPKVDLGQSQTDPSLSQTISPSPTLSNSGKLGSHVSLKSNNESMSFCIDQVCHGNVSELRMSRSAIVQLGGNNKLSLFAHGDESLRGIRVWGLPSFVRYADLNPHRDPILDLRYARGFSGPGFLGCLSEEMVQIFCY
ncbi:hypothetical protein LUZ60_014476 [Juncus effusus]|nr:hypothetical protein LUZ60_014476 [Juncus effusus]